MNQLGKYRKTGASLVAAALTWWQVVQESAPAAITAPEWRLAGVLLAGVIGVYGVTNESDKY